MHETGYFKLRPFMAGALTDRLVVSGHVIRRPGVLEVEYQVTGGAAVMLLPESAGSPERCHELWRQTCFELFFGIPGDASYWEVNLSPHGSWNVYHFTNYRTGMREESLAVQPICRFAHNGDLFSLACTIDCKAFVDEAIDLELAISCVIRDTTGYLSYWAIDHHGVERDFHNRAGFSMVMPGTKCDGATP